MDYDTGRGVKNGLPNAISKYFFVMCRAMAYFDRMDLPLGFCLSAKNSLEIADRANKCAWYLSEVDPARGQEGIITFQVGPS